MAAQVLLEPLRGGLRLALEEALVPGEDLLVCLQGCRGEALAATRSRLLLLKAGFPSGAWFVRKVNVFPLWAITSVEVSCGLLLGRLQVAAAGSEGEAQGVLEWAPLDGWVAAVRAENVVTFPARRRALFQDAAKVVWDLVVSARGC